MSKEGAKESAKDGVYAPPTRRNKRNKHLLNDKTPFVITEAYKTARTNLIFSLSTSKKKIVVITSANPSEGKSTTCCNMGLTLAGMGANTLIIDADLRKPTIHKQFGLTNKEGLSTLLSGLTKLDNVVNENVDENLDIITSGPIPPNPAELLASDFMNPVLEKLSEFYDYILIDTPPINVVTDSQLMNKIISGIVFVVWESGTTHTDISSALRSIEMASGKVLGFVKSNCNSKGTKYYKRGKYKYNYKYSYGRKPKPKVIDYDEGEALDDA